MPDAQLAIRLDAIAYLTGAEDVPGSLRGGDRARPARSTIARATGQGELLPMLIQALGDALVVRGLLGEAAEMLDGAIEGARLAGQPPDAGLEPPQPRVRRGARWARWTALSRPRRRASR